MYFPSPRTVGDSSPSPRTHPPCTHPPCTVHAQIHTHSHVHTHHTRACGCVPVFLSWWPRALLRPLLTPVSHTPHTAQSSSRPGAVRAVLRGSSQTGGVRAGDEPGRAGGPALTRPEASWEPQVPSPPAARTCPAGPLRSLHQHSG